MVGIERGQEEGVVGIERGQEEGVVRLFVYPPCPPDVHTYARRVGRASRLYEQLLILPSPLPGFHTPYAFPLSSGEHTIPSVPPYVA